MKRIVIAAALAIAAPFGLANAAGPFDGQYTGGSPAVGRTCGATTAAISVAEGKMTGNYKERNYTFPVNAAVAPDGTVTGRWGGNPMTGKVTGAHFEGSYNFKECGAARPIGLDKSG